MTLPNERSLALLNTRNFLRRLLDPKQTPRIPKEVRKEAYWCLKHFPGNYDINQAANKCPENFGPVEYENEYEY